jgi:hypothetical protein
MSLSIHWIFAWYSYVQEQQEHKQPIQIDGYFNETLRDTMENWQSEFMQLIWQVVGLSLLWYVGSSLRHGRRPLRTIRPWYILGNNLFSNIPQETQLGISAESKTFLRIRLCLCIQRPLLTGRK